MFKIALNKNWKMRQIGEKEWRKANISESILGDLTSNNEIRNSYFNDNELKSKNIIDYDYEYRKFLMLMKKFFIVIK